MMEEPIIEPKSNNYEHAHALAQVLIEEFFKRYDLTGSRIEEKTGASFDEAMDFWNYRMIINNKKKKPESKEEVLIIFEDIINEIYKNAIAQPPNVSGQTPAVDGLNEAYKFFVLNDTSVHPFHVKAIKIGIEGELQERFNPRLGNETPYFPGFNNDPNSGGRE